MSTSTHEKQISTVGPWLWLGSGGATATLIAVWAALAALYGRLDVAHGLAMIGLALVGGILIVIGMSERRRAEDWANWKEPARLIAETHATVRGNDEGIGRAAAQQEAILAQLARHSEVEAQRLEVLFEIRRRIGNAVDELKALARHGGDDATEVGGGPSAGVIAMPNARIYQLGIEEGLRRARRDPPS